MRLLGTSSMFRPVMIPPKHENAPPAWRSIWAGAPVNALELLCVKERVVDALRVGLELYFLTDWVGHGL